MRLWMRLRTGRRLALEPAPLVPVRISGLPLRDRQAREN